MSDATSVLASASVSMNVEKSRYWRIDAHRHGISEDEEDDVKFFTDQMNEILSLNCNVHPLAFVVYNEKELKDHNHDSADECDENCDTIIEFSVFALLKLSEDELTERMLIDHLHKAATTVLLECALDEWMFTPLTDSDYAHATRCYQKFRT